MGEQEGVIKFELDFSPGPPPPWPALRALNAWRSLLWRLRLLGRDPDRYGGYGYGNLSCRLDDGGFAISASQTGAIAVLGPEHYARVGRWETARNRVVASGPLPPSSESLTHAALYELDPGIACVLHVHSPEIWARGAALGLPGTEPAVPYGTPALAAEVARLLAEPGTREAGLFTMGGHADGVVAFGPDPATAGTRLIAVLARALEAPGGARE